DKVFRDGRIHPMIKIGTAWVEDLANAALELIYPPLPRCPFCGRTGPAVPSIGICSKCLQQLPIIEGPVCARCGRPVRNVTKGVCAECRDHERFYQESRSVGLYRDYLRTLILAIKYHGRSELSIPLGRLITARLEGEPRLGRVDGMIPIPLHPERLMQRGYNQADLIAYPASKEFHIPVCPDVITRERRTELQSKLSKEERFNNVHDAFRLLRPGVIPGKRWLLVDDILTTGYTASECAKTLLTAGASWVGVITLAVGLIEEQWIDKE
ncbi:MAG TPA: ComF family protein, partial [Bacillota bacterium]|nr:ComF family protein [Bacillota bacterium]